MHDPYTLIWSCGPFALWHRDRDGVDGACGWAYPRPTERQCQRLKDFAWAEAHAPVFQAHYGHALRSAAEAESLMRGLIVQVARALDVKVSMDQVAAWSLELAHTPGNNFRSSLAFMPGYHSNADEDNASTRELCAEGLYFGVARCILRNKRHFWQHPRWHFWHWRLQIRGLWRLAA